MDAVIRVENLQRKYVTHTGFFRRQRREVEALRGISFAVGRGEIFGLLGPNGAGKTTTIKILTTLLLPSGGRAEVLGYDAVRQAAAIRPLINVVFGGERSLYWRLSGRDNLQYFADLYKVPKARQKTLIPELLALVGLTEAADRRVETYSKGMKQRLSIARALINDPQVLFLDEPTIGLDPVAAHELRQLVAGLADRGTTIVLTTHYMFEAELLCQRIGIVNRGDLIALDTPAALKRLAVGLSVVEATVPAHAAAEVNSLRELAGAAGMQQTALGSRLLLQFPTERPDETVARIRERIGTGDVRVREATLEDAYVRLIGGVAS